MSYFTRIQVLPLGSYEYHGKELPPDTDTMIAVEVSNSLASRLAGSFEGRVVVLPPLTYGLSLEHVGRPTTAYVLHNTYYNFVKEVVCTVSESADLLVLVNGHGGNTHTLGALEGEFNCIYQDRKLFSTPLYSGPIKDICTHLFGENDVHAGSVEASLIAHYRRTPAREYSVRLSKRVMGSLRFFRSSEIAPDGVIKRDPTVTADPEKGLTLHDAIVANASESVLNLIESLSSVLSPENKS
jgi:creatinine amidohydrolase/Fe(II)-dependent formamide hydrolase-like protein